MYHRRCKCKQECKCESNIFIDNGIDCGILLSTTTTTTSTLTTTSTSSTTTTTTTLQTYQLRLVNNTDYNNIRVVVSSNVGILGSNYANSGQDVKVFFSSLQNINITVQQMNGQTMYITANLQFSPNSPINNNFNYGVTQFNYTNLTINADEYIITLEDTTPVTTTTTSTSTSTTTSTSSSTTTSTTTIQPQPLFDLFTTINMTSNDDIVIVNYNVGLSSAAGGIGSGPTQSLIIGPAAQYASAGTFQNFNDIFQKYDYLYIVFDRIESYTNGFTQRTYKNASLQVNYKPYGGSKYQVYNQPFISAASITNNFVGIQVPRTYGIQANEIEIVINLL